MLKKIHFVILFFFTLISCDETVLVYDISEEIVHILAPTNSVEIVEGPINFNWNAVDEATEYQVQIAIPNFAEASQIIAEQLTTTTTYTIELLPNEYEWRVRALNSAYETKFTTKAFSVIEE